MFGVGTPKSEPIISKYSKYANLELKIEICDWSCSKKGPKYRLHGLSNSFSGTSNSTILFKSYVSLDLSQSLILLFILKVYVKRLRLFGYRKVLRKENKYFTKIIIFL